MISPAFPELKASGLMIASVLLPDISLSVLAHCAFE
jgi:hypothetical protein